MVFSPASVMFVGGVIGSVQITQNYADLLNSNV